MFLYNICSCLEYSIGHYESPSRRRAFYCVQVSVIMKSVCHVIPSRSEVLENLEKGLNRPLRIYESIIIGKVHKAMIMGTVSLEGNLARKRSRQPISNWELSVHLFKQNTFSLIPLLRTNKYQVSRGATSKGLQLFAITVKALLYQAVWPSSLHR